MNLGARIIEEIGRLLNGRNNRQGGAIAHLAVAACRTAESLVYLADVDDNRFSGIWPSDAHDNAAVSDGHVRWAASGTLTSLDLCISAAGRFAGFAKRPRGGENSIRDFYSMDKAGRAVIDKRDLISPPWRKWIDDVVTDSRYNTLLRVRNVLVHADFFRNQYLPGGPMQGHSLRFDYYIGPLDSPIATPTQHRLKSREIIELSRDISLTHVGAFLDVLESL